MNKTQQLRKLLAVREAASTVYESIDFNITWKDHISMWDMEQLVQALKDCEEKELAP